MMLLVYLVIFSVAFWLRHRQLTGSNLDYKMSPEGKVYFETLSYSKKRRSVSPTLGLPLSSSLSFIVAPEKWYHRFLKSIGFAQELQTGDAELDRRLFFACDRPDGLLALIQKKTFHDAIRSFFADYRVKSLRAHNGKIWVQGETVVAERYTPHHAISHLRLLNALAGEIEPAAQNVTYEGGLTPFRAALLLMTGHAAFFTLGVFGGVPMFFETTNIISLQRFLVVSGATGAVLALFWAYLITVLVGRGSWLPMVVVDYLLMGLAGIFLSTAFVVSEANVTFDRGTAVSYVQPVAQKQCTLTCSSRSGKRRNTSYYTLSESQCRPEMRAATRAEYRSRDYKCSARSNFDYKLVVPPWSPEQNKNYSFSVSEDVFDRTRTGDRLRIPAHPGAFGITWVDTTEIHPAGGE